MSVKSAVATGAVVTTLVAATATAESVRLNLDCQQQTINSQVEAYTVWHGTAPWSPGEVARTQWRPLIDNGYLQSEPINNLSPREVATRIVELTEAGDRGLDLDPARAGWAWNSTDRVCYAVGLEQWKAELEEAAWAAREKRKWSFKPFLTLAGASVAVTVLFFASRLLLSNRETGASTRWQNGAGEDAMTIPSSWAAVSFWCGVLAVFKVTAPLALVVGTIAFRDVTRTRRRGLDRALFGVVMGAIFSAFLAGRLIELWPPNSH
jgi:hypothetical protein